MESGFSFLMLVFAVCLLLYGVALASTRNYRLLPRRASQAVKPKNPERYALQMGKAISLVSAAPALCALVGLWNAAAALIVLIAGLIVCIWLSTKIVRNE